MPQPVGSDLHVNGPLSNISVAYMQGQNEFIADSVFPIVPVSMASDIYYKYDKGNWYRTVAKERPPATESVGTGYTTTTDQYTARVFAVHKDVSDQDRARADSSFNLDRDATELVTRDLLLGREKRFVTATFGTGIWSVDLTGVPGAPGAGQFKQWDQATSTPIEDVRAQQLRIARTTGFRPNVLVLGPDVLVKLLDHPEIIQRIQYTAPGGAFPDLALLAKAFGVAKVVSPEVVENTAAEGAADSLGFVYGKNALLVYAAPSAGMLQPSGGYVFAWTGLLGSSAYGGRIKRFRMEQLEADRVEGEMAYDIKVVAPDVGTFFSGAVA